MSFGLLSKGKNPQCIQGAAAAHGLVALAYIGFCVRVYTHLYKGSILYAEPGHWCSVAHQLDSASTIRKAGVPAYMCCCLSSTFACI